MSESQSAGISRASQDLRAMGPWASMLVVMILHLLMGLDISLGGSEDDPRFGYISLGLFAVTAAGSFRWRNQNGVMAKFCIALILLHVGLAALALATGAVNFGLPFVAIVGVVVGALAISAAIFRRRA